MIKPLMFLAFCILIGFAVCAIVIAIWLGIESYIKNKRNVVKENLKNKNVEGK